MDPLIIAETFQTIRENPTSFKQEITFIDLKNARFQVFLGKGGCRKTLTAMLELSDMVGSKLKFNFGGAKRNGLYKKLTNKSTSWKLNKIFEILNHVG